MDQNDRERQRDIETEKIRVGQSETEMDREC